MKKILCPTDFSPVATNAVAYAARLAKQLDGQLHLFHAGLLSDLSPDDIVLGLGVSIAQYEKRMEEECLEITRVFKVSCYAEPITAGQSLASHISQAASDFDFLVMGTNGEDTLIQKLGGSNTYNTIRKAGIPVIVIPESCTFSTVTHIAYAFDLWRKTNVPMQAVKNLAALLKCKITIVQVMEAYSRDAEKEIAATQEIIKELHGKSIELSFQTLYNDTVPDALSEFMAKGQTDMLAVCYEEGGIGRLFFPGIVRQLSRNATYPIFVFR